MPGPMKGALGAVKVGLIYVGSFLLAGLLLGVLKLFGRAVGLEDVVVYVAAGLVVATFVVGEVRRRPRTLADRHERAAVRITVVTLLLAVGAFVLMDSL